MVSRRLLSAALLVLATDAAADQAPATLPSPAQADLDKVCAARKKQPVNKSKATKKPAPYMPKGMPRPYARWDGTRGGIVQCAIDRSGIVSGKVSVMHTPRCCRKSAGTCPSASAVTVPGTQKLVEHAELTLQGKLVSSALSWVVVSAEMMREPYCGRRPEGLHIADSDANTDDLGAQLAHMAELEAASVPAFERLARELELHGAPAALVRRARTAAADEVRHARMMTKLAARHGATPGAVTVDELPCRSLIDIAIENAVEGCVREAYGALVATYQGERAAPELRKAFRSIARDERRHAVLAEDVDVWIQTRLADCARREVAAARATAERDLRASLAGPTAVALFDAYFYAEQVQIAPINA